MKRIKELKIWAAGMMAASFFIFEAAAQQPGQSETQPPAGQYQAPQDQEVREDFSQEELQQFINANKEAIMVQQSAEQHMMAAIEEEGLDVEKFNEILTSRQNPDVKTDATTEDQTKFDNAVQKVMKIQEKMVSDMENAIQESGMSIAQYEEMLIAYQQSPKVQQQVNEMLMRESDMGSGAETE